MATGEVKAMIFLANYTFNLPYIYILYVHPAKSYFPIYFC